MGFACAIRLTSGVPLPEGASMLAPAGQTVRRLRLSETSTARINFASQSVRR